MKIERDEEIEERIHMEAIVDAYDGEEQALGWYYYLEDRLQFPFDAKCLKKESRSPLKLGECYQVVKMASEDDCSQAMHVLVEWDGDRLAVPLNQLIPMDEDDDETLQAVTDWHYWLSQGYCF